MARLLHTLLFEVSAVAPLTYLGVVAPLGVVALIVCYAPARRVARIDPVTTLRDE